MPKNLPVKSPKGGRPKVGLTKTEMKLVEGMSSYLNRSQIADALGIDAGTFRRICREGKGTSEDVDLLYKKGKSAVIQQVASSLVKNATGRSNNVLAQIFFLKCVAGWQEAQPEMERPVININYSEATSREARPHIEHEANESDD
tara:strand:+ start:1064 stop:1498 length:435 start_codon:yes stop_codon:yes gene_type:complete